MLTFFCPLLQFAASKTIWFCSFSTENFHVSPVLLWHVRSCMQDTSWIYNFARSWLTVTLNDSISLSFSELRSTSVNALWPLPLVSVTPAVNFPAILISRTLIPHEHMNSGASYSEFFLLDDFQMCCLPYMHWRPYNKSSNPLTGSVYTRWANFVSNSTQWATEHVTIWGG